MGLRAYGMADATTRKTKVIVNEHDMADLRFLFIFGTIIFAFTILVVERRACFSQIRARDCLLLLFA